MPTPFCQTKRNTINGYQVIVPAVDSLFVTCRPSTIAWLVIAIVINTLNGMFWRRLWSHISKECLETLPLVTYGDTTPAINGILRRMWVSATGQHCSPRIVLRRVFAMFKASYACLFITKTSAAERTITCNCRFLVNAECATIATTDPIRRSPARTQEKKHGPAAIPIAYNVFDAGWKWGRIFFSHVLAPIFDVVREASGAVSAGRFSRLNHYTTMCVKVQIL